MICFELTIFGNSKQIIQKRKKNNNQQIFLFWMICFELPINVSSKQIIKKEMMESNVLKLSQPLLSQSFVQQQIRISHILIPSSFSLPIVNFKVICKAVLKFKVKTACIMTFCCWYVLCSAAVTLLLHTILQNAQSPAYIYNWMETHCTCNLTLHWLKVLRTPT